MRMTSGPDGGQRRFVALASRPATLIIVAVVLLLGTAVGVMAALTADGSSRCQHAFVPAYFYAAGTWSQADKAKPSVMILDISGLGAGSAPVPHFRSVVSQAQAAGVTVLGYSSTAYGLRPAAAVEADARDYKAWYGVTGVFLDEVQGVASELPYYRQLASYIHRVSPGAPIWLNPGGYPGQSYMSVGDVVMVFEGTYAMYRDSPVPQWASHYQPARFAQTIYATSGAQLGSAISLAWSRQAGYVYVTNRSGSNPYGALPSYWTREVAAIGADCSRAGHASAAGLRQTSLAGHVIGPVRQPRVTSAAKADAESRRPAPGDCGLSLGWACDRGHWRRHCGHLAGRGSPAADPGPGHPAVR
jgi:hypothetical protein